MSNQGQTTGLYRLALAIAAVSCAFSLLVAIGLASNLMTIRLASPLNNPELDQLRTVLKANPVDDAVRDKIRDLDWITRRYYFNGLASRQSGIVFLLAGVAVSLISLRVVAVLRKKEPDPRYYPPLPDQLETESSARWSLAGVIVAVFTAALYLGLMDKRDSKLSGGTPRPAGQHGGGESGVNWSSFRGPSGNGVAAGSNAPVYWDGATGSGILWKAEVPLRGMSSPVIRENRVYVTGATEERREVYCYDIANGTLLWRMDVRPDPGHVKKTPEVDKETGFAAPTQVVDERGVYSLFANGDVAAIDHCSRTLWTSDLGLPANRYGHSSSLASYRDRILLQFDQDTEKGKTSKLIALDAATGKAVWATPRPVADSWPSPILIETKKGPQLVTVANDCIMAYDAVSGRELWKVKCTGSDVAPSPIYAGGLVVASITGDKVYAIRPDGTGDVTATHVAWISEVGVTDVASPVSDGELIYTVTASGMLICLEIKTGKKVWEKTLEGEFYGSPGLAGNHLYLVARSGQVLILKAGRQFEELGKATLGEPSDGSPVFVGDRILIRGLKTLFCVGARSP